MATDVYERLATFLDDLPSGFPTTDSGVEQRILRRLFSPEEAEFTMHLTMLPEPARVIARRAKIPVEEAKQLLQEMERKGLIFVLYEEGKEPGYMAIHWVIGIYEFQVNRLDAGLARDLDEYLPTWFDQAAWDKAPQMRTIPIGESISAEAEVMPYEQAEKLVQSQETFCVAPCICRTEKRLLGEGCDAPVETCLGMGTLASYYVRNGLGREIDREAALAVLAQAGEAGLVLQPANAKDALFICSCCGCCCGVLRNVKRHPKPASIVATAYVAALNVDTCTGCGTCETRCQMEAISVDNGHAVLDLDRCIGCGLCVTSCPTGSVSLQRKPEAKQPHVPKDLVDTNVKLGQVQGKLTTGGLVGMMVRSKVDRVLAPR